MSDKIACVILAAGKGTRMSYSAPKPLVPLRGKMLVDYPLQAINELAKNIGKEVQVTLVTGHGKEEVESYIKKTYPNQDIKFAFQEEQKGTGHALQVYFEQVQEAKNYSKTLIMCADTPLIRGFDLQALMSHLDEQNLDVACASFQAKDPYGYGRIVRNEGEGVRIVEQKDASDVQRLINEVNSGLYYANTKYLHDNISNLNSNNKSGEFYLTDLLQPDQKSDALTFRTRESFFGVNDMVQLSFANKVLNKRKVSELCLNGVMIHDIDTVYMDESVEIAKGVEIYPNTFFYGNTKLEAGVVVRPGCVLTNTHVDKNVKIDSYSVLEDSVVGESSTVGPFSRLRPEANVGANCRVGNFVEIKKSQLESGAKVSHLSYVGDSRIGEGTNIGCGFISVNYDGVNKHKTDIGRNSFVGSGCQTIAPVKVGDNSFVAAGSTINQDVPDGTFAIARTRQVNKEGLAKKFLKKKKE